MDKYSYEDVRDAYAAIIEVGRVRQGCRFEAFARVMVQRQHAKNLKTLNDSARELYEKLLNDPSINY